MNAWRSGVVMAKIRHQTVRSTSATTKLVVRPMSASSTTLSDAAEDERVGPALEEPADPRRRARPPTIWAPATIAAARPAMP